MQHIAIYLWTSETMSMRCTAHLVSEKLKTLTDTILAGCRLIDLATRPENRHKIVSPDVFRRFMSLRVEVRCDMIRRFAKVRGLASFPDTAYADTHSLATQSTEQPHYSKKHMPTLGSPHAQSMEAWRLTLDTTKTQLLDTTFAPRSSIAFSHLYAAEMYAPLLGIISSPDDHVYRVMAEAAASLSMLRWMDFLYALGPIKTLCEPVATAYKALANDYDRSYPVPRIDMLSVIVGDAMKCQHRSAREMRISRIGITEHCLTKEILPRITRTHVDIVLSGQSHDAFNMVGYLRCASLTWDHMGTAFFASLHCSFLSALAEKGVCSSTSWASLSESEKNALRSQVLGISPSESERCALAAAVTPEFWDLYCAVTASHEKWLSPDFERSIAGLPWPLQSVLWRTIMNAKVDPLRFFNGHHDQIFYILRRSLIDPLNVKALEEGKPALAIPALVAFHRCQVACAFSDDWGPKEPSDPTDAELRIIHNPTLSLQSWKVFERCSLIERLPLVAALFRYRDMLIKKGYEWKYDALIEMDVVSLICDSVDAILFPPADVVAVLLHYLPQCAGQLKQHVIDGNSWEVAFAKRFDLPLQDVMLRMNG
ncbi:hypothetical protein [Robbsia sp. KACC 23696]|uniref:hypothetical protein n=1 Tax=Robbsia sp. KACC 23696 TaxID=3149231 RepID=UPI00325C06FB